MSSKDTNHRRTQNLHAPVFKLSDNVLTSIFLISTPSWSSSHFYRGPTHIIARAISQVCSHWRFVALALPNLWKSIEIDCGSFEWIMELFHRSTNAPAIEIYSEHEFERTKSFFDAIIDSDPDILPRIRLLSCDISVRAWQRLYGIAQQPGAQLQDLDLCCEYDHAYSLVPITVTASPLRKLVLMESSIDLSLPFFSNISNLNLICIHSTMIQFASSIKNMPFLNRLSVTCRGPSIFPPGEPLSSQPIPVPSLRYLCTNDVILLGHLDIPRECYLKLRTYGYQATVAKLMTRRFISDHTEIGNKCIQLIIKDLDLEVNNCQAICYTKHNSVSDVDPDLDFDSLQIRGLRGATSWFFWLGRVMQDLSPILPKITFLVLEVSKSEKKLEEDQWCHLISHLHQFSGVQYLHLNEPHLQVLSALKVSYNHKERNRILFPSLRTFHSWHNLDHKKWRNQLQTVLRWRIKHKVPIYRFEARYEHSLKREWLKIGQKMARAYGVQVHFAQIPLDTTNNFARFLIDTDSV